MVRVDNKREKHRVPNYTTDWWNYGGITRDVKLDKLSLRHIFRSIRYNWIPDNPNLIKGYVQVSNGAEQNVTMKIPEARIKETFKFG